MSSRFVNIQFESVHTWFGLVHTWFGLYIYSSGSCAYVSSSVIGNCNFCKLNCWFDNTYCMNHTWDNFALAQRAHLLSNRTMPF